MLLFVMALNATTLFLWFAHQLSLAQQAGAAALILALLWAVGRVCESGSVFSRETALRGLQSKQE
jgi:predicted membrane protein